MKTLKYAGRFLIRAKSYTIINLLGLALSLACSIILMRYIHRELTVDTHCIDREQVYAVTQDMDGNRSLGSVENTIKDSVYIDPRYIEKRSSVIFLENDYVMHGQNRYSVRTLVTDSCFLQLFHYRVTQGNASLENPMEVLLTEACARRLFGNENPIGKVLKHSNGQEVTVGGLLTEPANKTMMQFDLIASEALSRHWGRMPIEFIRFMPGTDIHLMNKLGQQPRWANPNWKEIDAKKYTFSFMPLAEVYWQEATIKSTQSSTVLKAGSKQQILILSGVCLILLVTGILNFVNLYLICMQRRSKEYGLKKVFGSKGKQLFLQIVVENGILIFSALLVAWLIIEVTAIPVSRLFDYSFGYTAFDLWLSLGILLGLPLLTSIYPYVKYNYTSPIITLRSIGQGQHSIRTRMAFLFLQYIFAFLLITLSLYFNKQLSLLLHTNPGFRTENVLVARLGYEPEAPASKEEWDASTRRQQEFRDALKQCPYIENFEGDARTILSPSFKVSYRNDKNMKVELKYWYATPSFFKLYGIKTLEGEIPDLENANEQREILVANHAALKAFQYKNLSEAFVVEDNARLLDANAPMQPIIAIVEDFYDGHLSAGQQPIIFNVSKVWSGDIYQIAYTPGRLQDLLNYLREQELRFYGSADFEYSLLEDDVRALYQQDRQVAIVYSIFAFAAIVIASLGLFGLSLYDIRQRYREIAIRKVNGATIRNLYRLLFYKYLIVLGIAFLVTIPISFYCIHLYTQDFVIKAPIGIGIFVVALILVAFISLGTLMWQVRKAANINPAITMKTE